MTAVMTSSLASLSHRLAQFTHELSWSTVPAPIQHLARLHLVDALGVGLGAAAVPAHRALLQRLRAEGATSGPATMLGFGDGVPAPIAAMLNGTSIHSLEYDDTHMASIVHGSAVIVPAALAAGEAHGLALDEILRLVVAGWEVLVRLGEASPGGFQRRGFQVTSVGGVVVAALLGAVANGSDLVETVTAMGISGSQAGGIFEFLSNGSSVKAFHPGWAAHAGLWAAACAQGGMTGPATVLEGRFGLYNTYADDGMAGAQLILGVADLGQVWRLSDAAFKFFPCCHYIHPYLECVRALKPGIASVSIIDSVHCRVAPGAATVVCEPWSLKQKPKNGNEAKYSLPYCIARILLDRPVDIAAMTAARVDEEAVALAARIHWTPWADSGFPTRFDADLHVMLSDGTRLHHRVDQVFGSAQRAAGDEAIEAKFNANARTLLRSEARTLAWNTVMQDGPLDALQHALRSAAWAT